MPGVVSPGVPASLNPDRMRWIDRWLGVPLCFLLTVIARAGSALSPRRAGQHPPRRVLFIELAEMGSTVLACPAMHVLRTTHPDCQLFFLLFKHIDESVRVLNLVPDAHVMTIDVSSPWRIVRDTWRFMRAARRHRIDTAINLEMFARFSTILGFLSGATARVGFHPFTQPGLYVGDLFTHKVIYNPHIHTWQSLVTLVKALDVPVDELPLGKFPVSGFGAYVVPKVTSDASARRRMLALLTNGGDAPRWRRLIAINPNASKLIEIRKWPLDRYAELVARLLTDPGTTCVLTGVASESADARFIRDRVPSDRLIDLTGRTSLRDLLDLYNLADVLVTNDSGPAHFAALTNIHVVVFFGPETPHLYRPLTDRCTVLYSNFACSPCVSAFNQRRSACTNNRCLTHLSVESVHATVTAVLDAVDSRQEVI